MEFNSGFKGLKLQVVLSPGRSKTGTCERGLSGSKWSASGPGLFTPG